MDASPPIPLLSELCRLRFEHEFFRTSRFGRLVRLDPGGSTRRLGVGVRDQGESFLIHSRAPAAGGQPRPAWIRFAIEILDPDFHAYTRLDYGESDFEGNHVIYLNPLSTADGVLRPRTAPRLEPRSRSFLQPLSRPVRDLRELRLGPVQGPLNGVPLPPSFSRDPALRIHLDDRDPEGCEATFRYVDGSTESVRFFASEASVSRSPRMVFEWLPPAGGSLAVPTFVVRFEAVARIWRYFLTGIPREQWKKTAIRPVRIEGAEVVFEPSAEPETAPNGRPALVLQSRHPIPLSESPPFKVVLRAESSLDGQLLPHPGKVVGRLVDASGRLVACSDVVVAF